MKGKSGKNDCTTNIPASLATQVLSKLLLKLIRSAVMAIIAV